ncbi:MAG: MaoC family dehydratase [Alphaproteobacteria bacterium]|nr:MaoC family dehydratase [Alphaproteobacteria bacterium]
MSQAGNFFEDFRVGQELRHAPPRTLTEADATLYAALYGPRFPLHCARTFARKLGLRDSPIDDWLVFHVVFGKSVPDVSLNAVANLGYAGGVFGVPVFPGDTVSARSTVIGLKENSNRKTGVVWVRTVGTNQDGSMVADYTRWVMVRKRDEKSPAPSPQTPDLPAAVPAAQLTVPEKLNLGGYDTGISGEARLWDDFAVGEKIDHADGTTIEEAEHMMATRLYHNTARVHFNQHAEKSGRFGRRIVYGGHIISIARALSFNGLANAFRIAALNAGAHVAPTFAGDTIYAWSEILEKIALPGRADAGALRVRTIAVKDRACSDFPARAGDGYDPAVVLDLDYTILMPRRH